jgi:hypothetical protein
MWAKRTMGERRTIVVGAIVVVLVLLVRGVIAPYGRALADTTARLADSRELLARETALVATVSGYSDQLDTASERLSSVAPRLLPGSSEVSAQGALARLLERAAAIAPARIQQLDVLPLEQLGEGVSRVPIAIQAESDLEGMLTLLAALEAGPVLLAVEDLQVHATGNGSAAAEGAGPEIVRFGFVLSGVVLTHWDPGGDASIDPTAPANPRSR